MEQTGGRQSTNSFIHSFIHCSPVGALVRATEQTTHQRKTSQIASSDFTCLYLRCNRHAHHCSCQNKTAAKPAVQ
ncbi:hypothetical protein BLOT_008876 [Blomia tropicalis]|nr:hypothetical protein BLOT_008876 [Blomia tropicalis]